MNKNQIMFLKAKGFKERKYLTHKEWYLQKDKFGEIVITDKGLVLFHFYKECYQDFLQLDSICLSVDYYKNKLDEIELGE